MTVLDDFAQSHPAAVERRGGETFVLATAAQELIDEAEAAEVGILGMEGFLIGRRTYPALGRIADFSRDDQHKRPDFVEWSCGAARRILSGPWRSPPSGTVDLIHPHAEGRHMIAFVFADPEVI